MCVRGEVHIKKTAVQYVCNMSNLAYGGILYMYKNGS